MDQDEVEIHKNAKTEQDQYLATLTEQTWSIKQLLYGKMNQIARCDWLPERARWSHLARSGLPPVSRW